MHRPPTGHAPNECVADPHSLRSQNCSWHLQHVCFAGRYLQRARGLDAAERRRGGPKDGGGARSGADLPVWLLSEKGARSTA